MNQEEKRYKIKQKISFKEEMSVEKKKEAENTFWLGLSVLTTVLSYATIDHTDSQLLQTVFALGSVTGGIGSITMLKGVIESISKKTLLQSKIDDINLDLSNNEDNKSKGMR